MWVTIKKMISYKVLKLLKREGGGGERERERCLKLVKDIDFHNNNKNETLLSAYSYQLQAARRTVMQSKKSNVSSVIEFRIPIYISNAD